MGIGPQYDSERCRCQEAIQYIGLLEISEYQRGRMVRMCQYNWRERVLSVGVPNVRGAVFACLPGMRVQRLVTNIANPVYVYEYSPERFVLAADMRAESRPEWLVYQVIIAIAERPQNNGGREPESPAL